MGDNSLGADTFFNRIEPKDDGRGLRKLHSKSRSNHFVSEAANTVGSE